MKGNLSTYVPLLEQNFPNFGIEPMNIDETMLSESLLWIGNIDTLHKFTVFICQLIKRENDVYDDYLKWLRPYGCCKKNGTAPDSDGLGIQPDAVNENSFLAYYRFVYPFEMLLFPQMPINEYQFNRYKIKVHALPDPNGGA